MKRAAVVYRSHTGTTRRFGEEIGAYLRERGVDAVVTSIGDCDPATLPGFDYVLFGCWTNGLFVILQHPDRPWLDFARDVPSLSGAKVGLFTTYQLLTGSMFGKLRESLEGKIGPAELELKSRNGRLDEANKRALDRFIA